MASCENKYTTLLDLSRQAKVITGETACFDGKIQVGIPFSGYPTGIDTGTTVSLGVVSSETAVFSGNTGTTVFDVSNPSSPNYDALFSGFSGTVWTNALFSGNTSGLTLPITPVSADTQIVGTFWTLTQTATTSNGEYIIGTQYTGYTITYSFDNISDLGLTAYTAYSGFTSASQENFSAGTLDYKGPLDYISTKEDATVDGILTTKKLIVTDGASASTIGYVLTQIDEDGRAGWVYNSPSSGSTFTGNTSATCISDIYVSNLHSCSPLFINPNDEGNVYFGSTSAVTIDLNNGGNTTIGTDRDDVNQFKVTNQNASPNAFAQIVLITSGTTATDETSGAISLFGPDFVPSGTFLGSYLPNSFTITTGGGTFGDRQHMNIGSRRGSDAETRFFGGSSNFNASSLLGTFYTSGLTITDMVNTDTLRVRSGANNGYVLTSDSDGVGTWQASSGGGVTIDPYNNSGSDTTISWDVSGTSTNYEATLTGNTTLNLINVRNGDYGTIIVTQDGVGSHTLTFNNINGGAGTHYVVNGGAGSPTLTATASATDILSFTYNGTAMYWTVGNDYT